MRESRVRVDDRDTWYHCYNRIAGTRRDLPFGEAEKEQFVRILKRCSRLYTVKIVSYQVMSNHFHLLIKAPSDEPSADETCRRYAAFHHNRRNIELDSDTCRTWQARCRDISWFMRHVQQLFTTWYNRTRPVRRRGSLWADRFKHTILEDEEAAWACWKYIINNPVRARIVRNASDYRFSSYGTWRQTGTHPFECNLVETMLPFARLRFGIATLQEIERYMADALDEDEAGKRSGFATTTRRRVRHWTQGLVIGSELFVKEVMSRHGFRTSHRTARTGPEKTALHSWRNLRPVLQA